MGSDLALRNRLQEQGLLDRFEARAIAMAEEAGLEYIQLAGELWTRVVELERVKGVEPSDFQRQAGLRPASYEKSRMLPEPLQQLLSVPGVRKITQPAKFAVEGGYAIHCGGDGASDIGGIWDLVREQRPDWVKAQAIFLNLPLTFGYLQHGASAVAHATRNLTIGTTIDVGKAAANRESAPLAVIPFAEGGDPAVTALLLQAVQMMNANAERAELKADHAQATAEAADQKAERGLQLYMDLRESVGKPKSRPALPQSMRDQVWQYWKRNFYLECPCCHKQVSGEQGTMQVDHFYSHAHEITNLWLVCVACNQRMGKPGYHRSALDRQRFTTWQDRSGLQVVQMPLLP